MTAAQARSLETAFGDVSVAPSPTRVVTLYEGALDAALALEPDPVRGVPLLTNLRQAVTRTT